VTVPSPIPEFSPIVDKGVVAGFAFSSVTGDFNGDGKLDLAVCSFGVVSIMLGNGNGTFTPSPSLKVGSDAYSIATGDFNGDGKLDIVVPADNSISVLLGNGDGTFTPAPSVTIGSSLYNVGVGDLNGDVKLDLVVTDLPNQIHTLLGNGDGTFTAAQTTIVGATSDETQQLKMGDFDGDGKLDIAVLTLTSASSASFTGTATILVGDGTGGFSAKDVFAVGYVFLAQGDFTSMGVGDFHNDGKLDLAISGCGASPRYDRAIPGLVWETEKLLVLPISQFAVCIFHLHRGHHIRICALVVWVKAVPLAQVNHHVNLPAARQRAARPWAGSCFPVVPKPTS
jgi:FG-GAP-like repeat